MKNFEKNSFYTMLQHTHIFGSRVEKQKLIEYLNQRSDDKGGPHPLVVYPGINGAVSLKFITSNSDVSKFNEYKNICDIPIDLLLYVTNDFKINDLLNVNCNKIGIVVFDKDVDEKVKNTLYKYNIRFIVTFKKPEDLEKVLFSVYDNSAEKYTKIYDPKFTLDKCQKYYELISTAVRTGFKPAKDPMICRKAHESFKKPSECDYKWEPMNTCVNFPFGETKYDWFAFKGVLEAPDSYDPKTDYLRLRFSVRRNYLVREWDDETPVGPEGKYWINGKIVASVDEFHDGEDIDEVGDFETRIFTARCRASHVLREFGVESVNKDLDELVHRIKFLINLAVYLDNENSDKNRIIRILNSAVSLLDIRELSTPIPLAQIRQHDPTYKDLKASAKRALQVLRSIGNIVSYKKPDDPTISVIGYSHIDTCWLWPYKFTHFKTTNTAATMMHLMEHPPLKDRSFEWKFLATALQHYTWMKEDMPEIYERVMEKIGQNRWIVDGATWLEMDCNNPNLESLIRQFLYAFDEMSKLGRQSSLILPDCFGYPGNLPQVISGFGIDGFLTSKISWNEYNKFPSSSFVWKGIDGSDVLTHFITAPSNWDKTVSTYCGECSVKQLCGTFSTYWEKDISRSAALTTIGNGDGGGGITKDMLWNVQLMQELPRIESVPQIKFPKVTDIFDELRSKKDVLPVYDDELYLEYHRGTYTSQEEVKRQNRRSEALLRNVEFVLSVLIFKGVDVSKLYEKLKDAWRITLLNQFHDAIPGTSINEANASILELGDKLFVIIKEVAEPAFQQFSKMFGSAVINSISSERTTNGTVIPKCGWTSLPDKIKKVKFETDFYKMIQELDYQVITREFNYESSYFDSKSYSWGNKTVKTETGLTLIFNDNGGFTASAGNRQLIKVDESPFLLYEDRPMNWPAWDIQKYHKEMELPRPTLASIENKGDSLVAVYKANNSTITCNITFSSKYSAFDMEMFVDWQESSKLLKLVLPTNIRAKRVKYGIQGGYIERNNNYNDIFDKAKFEVFGRWCDLSDATGGVTVTSDVKTGYDVHDSVMMISLLKAPLQVDRWCDFGRRHFTIRIFPHNTPFSPVSEQVAEDIIFSPLEITGESPAMSASFIEVPDGVTVDSIKPSEDNTGIIVRIHEALGGCQTSYIKSKFLKGYKLQIVTLNEKPIDNEIVDFSGNYEFTIETFKIMTFKFFK